MPSNVLIVLGKQQTVWIAREGLDYFLRFGPDQKSTPAVLDMVSLECEDPDPAPGTTHNKKGRSAERMITSLLQKHYGVRVKELQITMAIPCNLIDGEVVINDGTATGLQMTVCKARITKPAVP